MALPKFHFCKKPKVWKISCKCLWHRLFTCLLTLASLYKRANPCGVVALSNFIFARSQKLGKSGYKCLWHSVACKVLGIFNSAQILVALWHCQFSFLQEAKSFENLLQMLVAPPFYLLANSCKSLIARKSLWRCGIAKFHFCKKPKVWNISCKCLWHRLFTCLQTIASI